MPIAWVIVLYFNFYAVRTPIYLKLTGSIFDFLYYFHWGITNLLCKRLDLAGLHLTWLTSGTF